MSKAKADKTNEEIPLEGMMLECTTDRYKLAYSAIRWAKEIKQKENLPDAIQLLIPRALRDILSGKHTIKEIEKLPFIFKIPTPAPAPSAPTITLNVSLEDSPAEKDKKDE